MIAFMYSPLNIFIISRSGTLCNILGSLSSLGTARHWAVEVKRKAGIDAVEQLTRYLVLLNRDPLLAPVGGVLAALSITPQARTLAEDRGIRCVVLDYQALQGIEPDNVLF